MTKIKFTKEEAQMVKFHLAVWKNAYKESGDKKSMKSCKSLLKKFPKTSKKKK
jgi:hypothetical protein